MVFIYLGWDIMNHYILLVKFTFEMQIYNIHKYKWAKYSNRNLQSPLCRLYFYTESNVNQGMNTSTHLWYSKRFNNHTTI